MWLLLVLCSGSGIPGAFAAGPRRSQWVIFKTKVSWGSWECNGLSIVSYKCHLTSLRSEVKVNSLFCCIHTRLHLQTCSVLLHQLAAATASRWILMETPRVPSTTWRRSFPNLTRPDRPTTTAVSDTHHFLFDSDTPRQGWWLLGRRIPCAGGRMGFCRRPKGNSWQPVHPTDCRVKRNDAKQSFWSLFGLK